MSSQLNRRYPESSDRDNRALDATKASAFFGRAVTDILDIENDTILTADGKIIKKVVNIIGSGGNGIAEIVTDTDEALFVDIFGDEVEQEEIEGYKTILGLMKQGKNGLYYDISGNPLIINGEQVNGCKNQREEGKGWYIGTLFTLENGEVVYITQEQKERIGKSEGMDLFV